GADGGYVPEDRRRHRADARDAVRLARALRPAIRGEEIQGPGAVRVLVGPASLSGRGAQELAPPRRCARAARRARVRPPDPRGLRNALARLGELGPARQALPAREGDRRGSRAPLRHRRSHRRRAFRPRSQARAAGARDRARAHRAADRPARVREDEGDALARAGRAGMGGARALLPRIHVPLGGPMDRRHFVRAGIGGALALAGARLWAAPAPGGTKFLVVMLRGAYDGASLLVPYSSEFYYRSRPRIAVPRPGSGDPNAAIRLDADWGLNAAAKELHALYTRKQAAFVPFCGSSDTSRSHFQAQDLMEMGQREG